MVSSSEPSGDRRDHRPAPTAVPPIPFGLADLPRDQQQVVESWDLVAGSHLMIAGQSRSGRSNCLRVLAGGIARLCSPEDVHLYGIDAGNNALLPLVSLPHVGAVVTRTQTDRMYRLVAFLQKELAERQQSLAERGFADIGEQRVGVPAEERLPYLVVLLDRWEGFVAAYESLDGGVLIDRITALLQEGAGVGIRIVMTADRSGLMGRISTLIEDRIALSLSDPGDFGNIGIPVREVPHVMPPGRAFRAGERPRELQWGLLDLSGVGTDQVRVLQEIGRRGGRAVRRPPACASAAAHRRPPAAVISAATHERLEPASQQQGLRARRRRWRQPRAPGLRPGDRRQRVPDHRPAAVGEEHRPPVRALQRPDGCRSRCSSPGAHRCWSTRPRGAKVFSGAEPIDGGHRRTSTRSAATT